MGKGETGDSGGVRWSWGLMPYYVLEGKIVGHRRMWMLGEIDGEGREVFGI